MTRKWNKLKRLSFLALNTSILCGITSIGYAQDVLPFPETPSASSAKEKLEDSEHNRRVITSHLPPDAPNIIVILMDDVGPATPSTYGGEINTPTLSKIAEKGISYNQFHSTAMSSPTRSSLLTGRNHTQVGNGQITEWANDWDGFNGIIPKTSATLPEVLKNYGYSTAAFGKWHNTPTQHTSKVGPFDYWPTGYGFEYFYGFLAGETSQYEPTLIKNTTYVHQPKTVEEGYHLTDDLADNTIEWIQNHQALSPDKPFFIYWAPGASHGPHHIGESWANNYTGKFDDGWDSYRERVFKRQKDLGWIPQNTLLTPRPDNLASWDSIPENERPFQSRLMEVFAGFTEHADYNAGRIISEIERQGLADNTLVFYIWGDNGSSAEGQTGSISELLTQNQIPTETSDHIKVLNTELGGLSALGGPKTDNMYHAGWAWAGSTPFKGTKLLASYFGGTRQPMAVSWPNKIKPNSTPRSQFHHVNDITPTIYDLLQISPPTVVNGFNQDPIDGISMAYSFNNATATGQKKTQFFDVMASRSIYHEGWIASTMGPRIPWLTVSPGLANWDSDNDVWELYNLKEDFSQATDLAEAYPEKLVELKKLFIEESEKNKNWPIGGGLYVVLHPEETLANPATEFNYTSRITRVPEPSAPRIGTINNKTTIDMTVPSGNVNGTLLAIGGFAGGLSLYTKDGYLYYEYNLFEIERTILKSNSKLSSGNAKVEMTLTLKEHATGPGKLHQGEIVILVNGKEEIRGTIPTLVTLGFSANECFDIGTDLGSPVSNAYYEEAPFEYNGDIQEVNVQYFK